MCLAQLRVCFAHSRARGGLCTQRHFATHRGGPCACVAGAAEPRALADGAQLLLHLAAAHLALRLVRSSEMQK
eukprot:2967238-Pleurochrysis_carterae.AAC.1